MKHIVILGNGIAGITAARHIRKKSDYKITVISGESEHFYSRTALMYIFMGHMKYEHTKPYEDWFWIKNRIELMKEWVSEIDFSKKQLQFESGQTLVYDQLILATGSVSNKFGWKGENLKGLQTLYSLQDLENMEENSKSVKRAVIVGGGLVGVEMAEMLHYKSIDVTYLIRENHFWGNVLQNEEANLIDHHLIHDHHIDLRHSTELEEILDDGKGHVAGVRTKSGEIIDCQFVGLTVGVSPNIQLVKNTALETERGILVDDFLKTNIPDVFAIGDCAQLRNPQPHRKPIEAVWYAGRMMGETVAKTISGNETAYRPGIWFNSAKFFDIEYQTYGQVPNENSAGLSSFYWESKNKKACIKIVFNEASKIVMGINTMGIRQRHEVWDEWLEKNRRLDYVIEHLGKANFDPELFKRYEPEIQQAYNYEFPEMPIKTSKKSFLHKVLNK